ncbi:hypothetical protein LTR70_004582 [Exophiala xenobiotica]|uniref:Uncharacterized protein n=1 Tax=Lithohypha guttulata TaxID=1690604 RepID=A0ABR0KCV8_9EURO|nr:hypothetical protein LTR24_004161 [Lithohypha guttulata]KAK5320356.1 hypothetical protein LTR70_004582 [Exophiala xenobiotica]
MEEYHEDERPAKRQKLDAKESSPATGQQPGYLILARRTFAVSVSDAGVYKALLKQGLSSEVEVLESAGTSDNLHARVRIPGLKTTTEIAIESISPDDAGFLSSCVRLPSTARKAKKNPEQPLAQCHSAISIESSVSMLELSILWHDSVYPREKADDQLRDLLYNQGSGREEASALQSEPALWDVKEFYDHVHVPPMQDVVPLKLENVQCKLYPFQDRATKWMLSREGVEALPSGELVRKPESSGKLPLDFREVIGAEGLPYYSSKALSTATSSRADVISRFTPTTGGILAEAMGLGKTVEMIALMCCHSKENSPLRYPDAGKLRPTGATLIITPPTILEQWKQEIREHAPSLRVFHYAGIKPHAKMKENVLDLLADQDVVLTTYSVIASEIHYVQEKPDRTLRNRPRRESPKSPLTQLLWWRCLLDEAQMVESGVSNAAIVARLIPRVNAWAVTGTPLKQSHRDLYGLLLFLRYEPWCQSTKLWDFLVFYHRDLFRKLIGSIALRHSKELVREELRIPAQSRKVVMMPFTAIEESHYAQMHYDMQQDCGFDSAGGPLDGEWDPENPVTVEKMRNWLQRLRQTCLHPEVGGRNRKALGKRGGGPLRTVAQVLDVMIEQTDSIVHTEQRNVLMARADQARIFEHARKSQVAQNMFTKAYDEATIFVAECRTVLAFEIAKSESLRKENMKQNEDTETEVEEVEEDADSALTTAKQRLRAALEVQHICIFFIGNTYYQLKQQAELALSPPEHKVGSNKIDRVNEQLPAEKFAQDQAGVADSASKASVRYEEQVKARLAELEKSESNAYEEAKKIRTELLAEVHRKANKRIKAIRAKRDKHSFDTLPLLEDSDEDDFGGIESRKVFEKLYHYCKAMNAQAEQFRTMREKMAGMLCQVLIDEEEGVELTGEEYEDSTKHQDEMYVVMEMLRALFADRSDAISGQENLLLKQETKQFLKSAKEGEGPAPELMIRLFAEREKIRINPSQHGSLRGVLNEIRSLASSLEWQESVSTRAKAELVVVNKILQHVQKLQAAQAKSINALEQEVNLLKDTMNARLDYYRALQVISDMVAPIGEDDDVSKPVNQAWIDRVHGTEETAAKKLSIAVSKKRYLLHLKNEQGTEGEAKICTICQFEFEIGTLTVCGHQFCKECIQMWWSEHRNCPVCKRRLHLADFYDVTYKPPEPSKEQVQAATEAGPSSSQPTQSNTIYTTISPTMINKIKSIDLRGSSYGSKVDTLVRHILHLRKYDPGSKSIIFSQYRDFLEVLSKCLRANDIIHSKFDDRDGIIDFKSNPANECFLLHAKAHSAGLNLVCASHVVLCEPLINTAIELQAVARVHRIGQVRETCVWMYIVENTVEEAIYDISVQRRLAHMDSKSRDASRVASRAATPGVERGEMAIEAANAKELQAADLSKMFASGKTGGEMVDKEDLWRCLFGNAKARDGAKPARALGDLPAASDVVGGGGEIARHLRAEAAEGRGLD